MPGCLIISKAAPDYAREVQRLAGPGIAVKTCRSAEEALSRYAGEKVLFGNPDMIAEVLPNMPAVDWVQSTWAGVAPLLAAGPGAYTLTGVKGVFGEQMSEYVIGYLLAHELKIVERWQQQRRHSWHRSFSGTLQGKRLGIMGTGSIGRHIAGTARHFGLRVHGLSRSGDPAANFDEVMDASRLHEFLAGLDYLVCVLPATSATQGLLDTAALCRLPAHAVLVNVGRSNVVDDAALAAALRDGTLAAAVLDVFDDEPLPRDSPLWDVPNLYITPHVAAISHPALIAPIFVENYRRYINKQPLNYVVDFSSGY